MRYTIFVLIIMTMLGAGCTQNRPVNQDETLENTSADTTSITQDSVDINTTTMKQNTSTQQPDSSAVSSALTLETPAQLVDTNEPQEAVFYVGYGWTGGMGDPVVREDDPSLVQQFDNLGVYLESGSIEQILAKGGPLPDCYYDPLMIKVSANVSLSKTSSINHSVEDAPEQSYYELHINTLHDVLIHADACEE